MNSMVKIRNFENLSKQVVSSLADGARDEKKETLLKDFAKYHLWVLSTTDLEEMRAWDKLAFLLDKPLFVMFSCGFYSFCYCSFGPGYEFTTKKNPGKDNERIDQVRPHPIDHQNFCLA
jgi:hypothetical protein